MRKELINKRKAVRLTQNQVAEKLEISLSFYRKIEQGRRNPGLELAQRIAEFFNATIDEIFFNYTGHEECHELKPPKSKAS